MATKPAARVIDGRYQLGRVIGRGGMATIHQAFDLRLERPVAVKLLRPEVVRDADLAGRFRREALAATVLRHPNIVACLDTGTADGQPYLVMDLIDGEDLAARLKRGGRLAAAAAARIGLDVARALGAAHLRGIVHRDVKPGNILLAPDGRAMITDFGIARLAADAEAARSGTTLGSVHYFSPEQARGAPTSPASDIYGLGLVLYEALTGTRPFGGESTDAIALARIDAEPPSPKAIRPEVPSELDAVVQRALAPHPDDRYANGAAMAAALEPVVQHLSDASITTTVATPIVAGEPAPAAARSTRATPRRSKTESAAGAGGSRSGVAVALVALLGITGGAIVVAALPGSERPVGSSAASQALVVPPDPSPTPEPTPEPTPTPDATPEPTPEPSPEAPTVPPGRVADLCEVFFDIPCGLVAGRYAPSRFEPAFDIQLGDGWSSVVHRNDLVSLAREEGSVTFAGPIREVYPNGESDEVRSRARDLIRAFIATEGVGATSPATVRIGGRRGLSTDLAPSEHERVALFSTESSTYHLEPERITRIVVMDLRGGRTILIAIESRGDHDLRDILDTADPAAGTIRWR